MNPGWLRNFQIYQEEDENRRFNETPGNLPGSPVMYSYVRECVYMLLTFINSLFIGRAIISRQDLFDLIKDENPYCKIPIREIGIYLDILTEAGLLTYLPYLDSYRV